MFFFNYYYFSSFYTHILKNSFFYGNNLIIVIVFCSIRLVLNFILKKIVRILGLSFLDMIFGSIFGVLRGLIIIGVFYFFRDIFIN